MIDPRKVLFLSRTLIESSGAAERSKSLKSLIEKYSKEEWDVIQFEVEFAKMLVEFCGEAEKLELIDYLMKVLRNEKLDEYDQLQIASMLLNITGCGAAEKSEAIAGLTKLLGNEEIAITNQIAAAVMLVEKGERPEVVKTGKDFLVSMVHNEGISASDKVYTATIPIEIIGEEVRADVIKEVMAIFRGEELSASEKVDAANLLIKYFGEEVRAEVIEGLRAAFCGEEGLSVFYKVAAARILVEKEEVRAEVIERLMEAFRGEELSVSDQILIAKILIEKEEVRAEVIGRLMEVFRGEELSVFWKVAAAKILVEKGEEEVRDEVIDGLMEAFRGEELSVSDQILVAKILIEKEEVRAEVIKRLMVAFCGEELSVSDQILIARTLIEKEEVRAEVIEKLMVAFRGEELSALEKVAAANRIVAAVRRAAAKGTVHVAEMSAKMLIREEKQAKQDKERDDAVNRVKVAEILIEKGGEAEKAEVIASLVRMLTEKKLFNETEVRIVEMVLRYGGEAEKAEVKRHSVIRSLLSSTNSDVSMPAGEFGGGGSGSAAAVGGAVEEFGDSVMELIRTDKVFTAVKFLEYNSEGRAKVINNLIMMLHEEELSENEQIDIVIAVLRYGGEVEKTKVRMSHPAIIAELAIQTNSEGIRGGGSGSAVAASGAVEKAEVIERLMEIFRGEGLSAFKSIDAAKILVEKKEVRAEVIERLMGLFRKELLPESGQILIAKILVEKGSEAEKAAAIQGLMAIFRGEKLSVSGKVDAAKILVEKKEVRAEVIERLMVIFRGEGLSLSEKICAAKILIEKGSEVEKAEVIE